MMYDLRCNAGGARPIKVRLRQGMRPRWSTTLKCTCAEQSKLKGKHKVNTTKIKRKRSPDSGIESETSVLPGSVLPFTPPGLLRNVMIELL